MKKFYPFALALLALVSCSAENELDTPSVPIVQQKEMPSTEVFVGGMKVKSYRDLKPKATSSTIEATYDNVYYFIRIDSRIPNIVGEYNTGHYFPQDKRGRSVMSAENKGSIKRNYEYNYLGTRGVSQYVYDPTGVATKAVFVEEPTLEALLRANEAKLEGLQNVDFSKLKVIWYVVKNQPGDTNHMVNLPEGAWHVDGVLTTQETKNVTEIPNVNIGERWYMQVTVPSEPTPPTPPVVTPEPPVAPTPVDGYVKVDLHQQQHNTWEAIKTTIHIGANVDRVNVTIPILREDIAEKDDFAIRTYDAYYTINADTQSFQEIVKSEYKNDPTAYVVSLSNTPAPLTEVFQAAAATAQGDVFAVYKGVIAERLFYVKDNVLYEFDIAQNSWQSSSVYNMKVHVSHEDNQIVISVDGISPNVIEAQRLKNPDGLTIEVVSYPRQVKSGEDLTDYRKSVFEKIKQSVVSVGFNQPLYSPRDGQPAADGKLYTKVSSAFFE